MGNCADCHWWLDPDTDPRFPGWGACELTESDYASGVWPDTKAVVDSHAHYGVLRTAPDFGCVQFRPKDG